MKIISKFQDYYDIGVAYGVDEKLRFERETIELKSEIKTRSTIKIVYRKQTQNYRAICHFDVVLFCNNIYPLVHIIIDKIDKKDKKFIYATVANEYCYSMQEIDEVIANYYKPIKEIKDAYTKIGYCYWWGDTLDAYIGEHFKVKPSKYMELLKQHKVPYLYKKSRYRLDEKGVGHIDKSMILLPQLKQYKFAKAVSPMQAFQEISMFLGQLDLAEDNVVTIEDKYLAQGKGFDCYSFKKMPSKRKVKSC